MKRTLIVTGLLGLAASILVGVGEYLLHFDPQARFSAGGYDFMQGISADRSTLGHFFGVFGAALYLAGCYHIYLMLRPSHETGARVAALIAAFGFVVGAVWIGSRASVSALMQIPASPDVLNLIALYELRYETLLNVTRFSVLTLSAIFVWLVMTGRTRYPKWMALANPFLLIILSFVVFLVAPNLGKHLMPIALNVAFFIFFCLSLMYARSATTKGE